MTEPVSAEEARLIAVLRAGRAGSAAEAVRRLERAAPRRAQLWRFIAARVAGTGMSPSYAEMLAAMGWASKAMVHRDVAALAQAGLIRVAPKRVRCIEVLVWPRGLRRAVFVAVQLPGEDMRLERVA